VRTLSLRVVLPLLGLLVSFSLCGAQNPAWNNLKQLSAGMHVRVVANSKNPSMASSNPPLTMQSSSGPKEQTRLFPVLVCRKFLTTRGASRAAHPHWRSYRAGAGLGTGAAIDNDCSPNSIVCTGNKGKPYSRQYLASRRRYRCSSPRGGWQEVYRAN